ncbi:T9SS type A sorting domain-containing protein [candidate division KSB1 bacterium]|nr:T9SS type A sorting domain-containing protein [candidate division KSB1 bacterium]
MYVTKCKRLKYLLFCLSLISFEWLYAQSSSLILTWNPNSEPDLMGYKIHQGLSSRNYDTVIDVGMQNSYEVQGLKENTSYFFAVSAYDSAFNQSAYSEEATAILESKDLVKPAIAKCKIIDETHVDIEFTEPITKASAERKENYSISDNIQVVGAVLDADTIHVHLTTSKHRPGFSYSVTVNNIQDMADEPNTIQANSTGSYYFPVAGDGKPPYIVSAKALSQTRIVLVFNEMVTRSSAENKANYQIDNNIEIFQAQLFEDCITVHLTTSEHAYEKQYQLTVTNIYDREEPANCITEAYQVSYLLEALDKTPPEIVSVVLAEPTKLNIQFSEPVSRQSAVLIKNYSISDSVVIQNIQFGEDSLTVHLTTTAHQLDTDYTIIVANIYDCATPPNKISENASATYRLDSVDNIKPELVTATIFNEEQVHLLFSEPITQSSAETVENYKISGDVQVLFAALHSDLKTAILKTSSHKRGVQYTITVNNIADRAKNPNVIEQNTTASYLLAKLDNEKPFVLEVKIIEETKIEIQFNEPVERTSAEDTANYHIDKGVSAISARLDQSETIVSLSTMPHLRNEVYSLMIENVMDHAENKIESGSYTYYLATVDTLSPELKNLLIMDNEHLALKFSEQLERLSAEDQNNYKIDNGISVLAARLDDNLSDVYLTTSTHRTGVSYKIQVNNIRDRAIPPNVIATNSTLSYELKSVDDVPPAIVKAEILSETKVDLVFTEALAKGEAEKISNYQISDNVAISDAVLDMNLHVVHLTTSEHQRGKTYTITVNNISDLAEFPNCIAPNSNYTYYFEIVDLAPPHIQKIDVVNRMQLDIYFDEQLDPTSAQDVINYNIDKGIAVLDAGLADDLMVVRLTTSEHRMGETYTISVNHVKDNAPNPNEISNLAYSYYQEFIDNVPPEIVSVVLEDANHVLLSFSEKIDLKSAQTISYYKIDNGIFVLNAEVSPEQDKVRLTTTSHRRGLTYMLTVNRIKDRAPKPNLILANSTNVYYYEEEDNKPPYVVSTSLLDQTGIDVTFSEQLDQVSAEDLDNYVIDGGIQVLKASLANNLRVVHLSTTIHERGKNYYAYVSNIKDRAEEPNTILPNTMISYYFEPVDMTQPRVDSVLILDATKVDVYFSEPVEFASAEEPANYQITNSVAVIKAKLDETFRVVHLATSAHLRGLSYRLSVINVKDRAPAANIIEGNSTPYTFELIDVTPPKVIAAQVIKNEKIKISFSERINRNSAQDIKNYAINNYIEVIEAELDSTECDVYLYTTRHQGDRRYTITINNICDMALVPNMIERNSSFSYWLESESILKNINMVLYEADSVGLGDRYYIDRSYTIIDLPESKNNLLWIKTANSDRDRSDEEFLTFTSEENVKVYVGYDSRASHVPEWLRNTFKKTNVTIQVSDQAGKLNLWEKVFPAGKIQLGGNLAKGARGAQSMYVVLVESPQEGDAFEIEDPVAPQKFALYQNYPNPFNGITKIRFDVQLKCRVSMKVYNILGQQVKTLVDQIVEQSQQVVTWDATNDFSVPIASGLYFIHLTAFPAADQGENNQFGKLYSSIMKLTYVK